MKQLVIAVTVMFTFVGLAGSVSAQPQYVMTDLGTLGGSGSDPEAINALGQVCGNSFLPGDVDNRAFRTAPNAVIVPATSALGTLGGSRSNCRAMNTAGQAVGFAHLTGDILRAFRTAPNAPINPATDDLGTLGGAGSIARAINSAGQVAGTSDVLSGPPFRAFRTQPNSPINPATDDLGTLEPGTVGDFSEATGMNESGQVVGNSRKSIGGFARQRAFRTAPGAAINPATDDLGTLGGSNSQAENINDAGQVVGWSATTDDIEFESHAFRTAPNAAINPATDDLGTLGGTFSVGLGINTAGDVVGWSETSGDTGHAFLFTGGTMYDLNDLVPPGSGWELTRGFSINDNGQIAARAVMGGQGGQEHAFRLDVLDGGVGTAGGTVQDQILGSQAQITFPPGAVAEDTAVVITVFDSPLSVPIPAGFQGPGTNFVSISLIPQPSSQFPPGVSLVLPLTVALPVGSQIPLYFVDTATGMLLPMLNPAGLPVVGVVAAGGQTATFIDISHLSIVVGLMNSIVTPESQIQELITDVQGLVDAGKLRSPYGRALKRVLEAALQQLNRDREKAAVLLLKAFIGEVKLLVFFRLLPADAGKLLVEQAQSVIAALRTQ